MPEELAEQTNRLQEVLRTLAGGSEGDYDLLMNSIKASVLTAFYTPKFIIDTVANQIHTRFRENGLQMRSFLEPSAGIGGFLPVAMGGTHSYAIEKDIITGLVLSLLHDEATTMTGGFEAIDRQELEHRKFDVIASNIPFGNFRVFDTDFWKKGGIYEQATKTIHNYFFVKAMELLNEDGLLAFVTSRGGQRPAHIPEAHAQGIPLAPGEIFPASHKGKCKCGRCDDGICQQTVFHAENRADNRQPHREEPIRQICTQTSLARL